MVEYPFYSMLPKTTQITIAISLLITVACDCDVSHLGRPENNILTVINRADFTFSAYPTPLPHWGEPKNVADERQALTSLNYNKYGVQVKADKTGIAYIQVDLKRHYIIRAFAITGNPDGGRKPRGEYFLEGSNNGLDWRMVGVGKSSQWHAPGTYPFRKEQVVPAIYPNSYRYYRVVARGWEMDHMIVFNWGLFV